MATLPFFNLTPPSSFTIKTQQPQLFKHSTQTTIATTTTFSRSLKSTQPSSTPSLLRAYKVTIEHEGQSTELQVDEDETILSKALDSGLDIPHDCKLGVCMTCPAKIISGKIDQTEGMLSDDVIERGFGLLCVAYPRSDCSIRTIPEEELLSLQLATAND